MEVLEHDQDRLLGAPGPQEVFERAPDLIGHRRRVPARGAEREAPLVVEVHVDELSNEVAYAGDIGRRHLGGDVGPQPLFDLLGLLQLAEAGRLPDELRHHRVGDRGVEGIAAALEHSHCRHFRAEPPVEFMPEPRLAGARFGRHEDHLRAPAVAFALGEGSLQDGELSVATAARRRLPVKTACGIQGRALAHDASVPHVEARGDQRGGGVVDPHAPETLRDTHHRHGAIDRLAHGEPCRVRRASRGHGDLRASVGLDEVTREPRQQGRLVGRGEVLRREHDGRAVREHVRAHAEELRGRIERLPSGRSSLPSPDRASERRKRHDEDRDEAPFVRRERVRGRNRRAAALGEPLRELGTVGRSLRRILVDHPAHEKVQERRDVRPELADRWRVLEEDLREDRHEMRPREEALARQALEQDATEREDVDRWRDLPVSARLLGSDEVGRADEHARLGDRARRRAFGGEAHVDQLNAIDVPAGEEDVAGLEIAMDEAAPVQVGERVRHRPRDG